MVETTHNKRSFGRTLTKICLHIKFLGISTGIITGGDFLFLEHDAYNELCTLKHTEKGVRLKNTHRFEDIFN